MAARMKKSMAKRKLAEMSVDDFMNAGIDSDDSDSFPEEEAEIKNTKQEKGGGKHKKSLEKLKKQDPEFYEFLQMEDQNLLDFQDDDDEYDESDDDDIDEDMEEESDKDESDSGQEDESSKVMQSKSSKTKSKSTELDFLEDLSSSDEDDDKKFHKLPKQLEVASDDSEDDTDDDDDDDMAEDESEEKSKKKKKKTPGISVTMKMVKEWNKALQDNPNLTVLKEVIAAFKAAVQQTGSSGEVIKYSVEGSMVFNAVVRLCLANISPALHQFLGLPPLTDLSNPSVPSNKNKKWKKIRLDTKSYLTDLLKLLGEISEQTMVDVILKHIHKLVAFYSCFPKLAKIMMKKMINLWSMAEETTRVLAFFCVNRLVRISQSQLLETCIKQMYMAYVKNCKFTSPTTLPMINFMQRSLVEIFAIDFVLAYQYTFVYIRQLAIHLRNAITVKKKETCQTVYNWQYIHCLELWVKLLSTTYPNDALEPLVYPLTQTIIGTIKLLPTTRYFPLRFHCIRALNMLSEATETFIPVLPFLLEVFELTNFNKRHANISFKPFNFACLLKLSKAQLQEKSFRDGVIDQLYELLLDQFHVHSHSVGFPELVLPAVLQLKNFLKKCKVANYCKQMKQIVDKVEENSKFIINRRKTLSIALSDTKAVAAWERKCQEDGTPLGKYYKTWRKLRDRELQHQIAAKDQIVGVDNLPTVVRPKGPRKATDEEKKEFSALFDSSSEDEEDQAEFLPTSESPAKKRKTAKKDSESDDNSDLDSDELDILTGSGNSSDESEDEGSENDESDEDESKGNDRQEENDEDDEDDVVEDFQMSDSD